jgi:DNA-directed RNA polymerase alpha subunit
MKDQPKSKQEQEALEAEWYKIGLTAPARKALVEAKLYRVSDLRKVSVEELGSIPGVSKSAIARIKVIMKAKKINFRN